MRIYAYIRVEPNDQVNLSRYIECFKKHGYSIQSNRILTEEVTVDTPIEYRDKILNLIKYNLEIDDVLIVKSLDCLGSNFLEIKEIASLIYEKEIILICSDFSRNPIKGDLKKIFFHFIKMGCEFESQVINYKRSIKQNKLVKKVGRPELLDSKQKQIVLDKFKKGQSVYSLAKEFDVTRTVIQRVLDKFSEKLNIIQD